MFFLNNRTLFVPVLLDLHQSLFTLGISRSESKRRSNIMECQCNRVGRLSRSIVVHTCGARTWRRTQKCSGAMRSDSRVVSADCWPRTFCGQCFPGNASWIQFPPRECGAGMNGRGDSAGPLHIGCIVIRCVTTSNCYPTNLPGNSASRGAAARWLHRGGGRPAENREERRQKKKVMDVE